MVIRVSVMLVRPLGLITARIMPTPGTEIAKASLADSSPVRSPPGQDKVATVKLSRTISHLGQRRTEPDIGHQGVKGASAMLTLTPALS